LRLQDRRVSRRHLSAVVSAAGLLLRDLRSTNGTQVGPVRVLEWLAQGGELIDLGESRLAVRVSSQPLQQPEPLQGFGELMGASPAMRAVYPLCERIAQSDVTVLVEGETGTGKEVLAEALHYASSRQAGPFVVFDCTAAAPSLVESELFGHEKGAFTGAVSARKGVFEQADRGTLLIDEIGDLELSLQAKLLRAIERLQFRRVGGQTLLRADVRIVCATRRDLDQEVQSGRFRDDLFHRIAVARIPLPPLRERRGDVTLLAQKFEEQLGATRGTIPYELLLRWESAPWPGNVRELRNAVARTLALGDLAHPAAQARSRRGAPAFRDYFDLSLPLARQRLVDDFERAYVEQVLASNNGNINEAARASGIARRQFFRLKSKAKGITEP
jgi:transcriptional regulator with GAF, ATPase, and Fis domain